ncbi:methyltransferase domain-containing protein [Altererythrobacter aurantiacus]|uniref:Methyltransferase domain-containing protein n=1 Tax=Parapontixanthobacter aurantiacus TaxID=1463599 RepID=A0A844ZBY1_9SPHN|nr:methyltransferase domain-containing protein [Parapontixanthobacter aurantiacus]MXO84643.1 methyltransferase domain-containing protein [Parapontixanthobacter aurantiacus]
MAARYDTIGINYAPLRRPDDRIANQIHRALGTARSVLNVGAGTGSYEPTDREVTAVEPSIEMIRKRAPSAAPCVQACAENLPFDDRSFDAAMAILTVHHWSDIGAGLREMRRVTRGPIVLLTFDPACRPWLTDYLPELAELDDLRMPAMADYSEWLGTVAVEPVLIPHDCTDGFLYAYWRRPEAYLDERMRSGSSSFWALTDVDKGLEHLSNDLETGEWDRSYGHLRSRDNYDAGYRLVISTRP